MPIIFIVTLCNFLVYPNSNYSYVVLQYDVLHKLLLFVDFYYVSLADFALCHNCFSYPLCVVSNVKRSL